MVAYLKMLRTMVGYALVTTLLVSPVGWFYAICGIGCFFRSSYCFKQWFALDVLACTTCHNTFYRTISGYTGERLHKKRYKLQGTIIDKLAEWCGDGKDHCLRAYIWERNTGRIRGDRQ